MGGWTLSDALQTRCVMLDFNMPARAWGTHMRKLHAFNNRAQDWDSLDARRRRHLSDEVTEKWACQGYLQVGLGMLLQTALLAEPGGA